MYRVSDREPQVQTQTQPERPLVANGSSQGDIPRNPKDQSQEKLKFRVIGSAAGESSGQATVVPDKRYRKEKASRIQAEARANTPLVKEGPLKKEGTSWRRLNKSQPAERKGTRRKNGRGGAAGSVFLLEG